MRLPARLTIALVWAVLAVAVPSSVTAAPITIRFDLIFDNGPLLFGAGEPVARYRTSFARDNSDLIFDGRTYNLSGDVTFQSGLLEGYETTFGTSVTTIYRYGPGTLRIAIDSIRDEMTGESFPGGTFEAEVGPFVLSATDAASTGPFGSMVVFPVLGAGRFDEGLAAFLGVSPNTIGGTWGLFFDRALNHPTDYQSPSRTLQGFGDINVTAVPEPGLSALVALALGAVAVRRRGLNPDPRGRPAASRLGARR